MKKSFIDHIAVETNCVKDSVNWYMENFNSFGLNKEILKNLNNLKLTKPTPLRANSSDHRAPFHKAKNDLMMASI